MQRNGTILENALKIIGWPQFQARFFGWNAFRAYFCSESKHHDYDKAHGTLYNNNVSVGMGLPGCGSRGAVASAEYPRGLARRLRV